MPDTWAKSSPKAIYTRTRRGLIDAIDRAQLPDWQRSLARALMERSLDPGAPDRAWALKQLQGILQSASTEAPESPAEMLSVLRGSQQIIGSSSRRSSGGAARARPPSTPGGHPLERARDPRALVFDPEGTSTSDVRHTNERVDEHTSEDSNEPTDPALDEHTQPVPIIGTDEVHEKTKSLFLRRSDEARKALLEELASGPAAELANEVLLRRAPVRTALLRREKNLYRKLADAERDLREYHTTPEHRQTRALVPFEPALYPRRHLGTATLNGLDPRDLRTERWRTPKEDELDRKTPFRVKKGLGCRVIHLPTGLSASVEHTATFENNRDLAEKALLERLVAWKIEQERDTTEEPHHERPPRAQSAPVRPELDDPSGDDIAADAPRANGIVRRPV